MNDHPGWAVCPDTELGYVRNRTRFAPGAGLVLDDTYRLAHLPLVAPDHPLVIPSRDGTDYRMGRHEKRIFSLVIPIPDPLLQDSPSFREMENELRSSPFAKKIAWRSAEQRRHKLHATVCGSVGLENPPALDRRRRRELARIGPVNVELRGLFSGNINVGRLYLRAYPEHRDGVNVFRRIQRILGRPETDVYVVGLYNLLDNLAPGEAASLEAMIGRWWHRAILQFTADRLLMVGTMDDLVLDSAVVETVALRAEAR